MNHANDTDKNIPDYIQAQHPEYSLPDACVNKRFIRLIDKAYNVLHEIDDLELDLPDDEEVEAALEKLPKEMIENPLASSTIDMIGKLLADTRFEGFIKSTADSECVETLCFNNRANARAGAGRYNEALSDYNRACGLDPNEITCFLNRASFYLRSGQTKEAVTDALYVLNKARCAHIEAYQNAAQLAYIFYKCGRTGESIESALLYANAFKWLLENSESEDKYFIKINGLHMSLNYESLLPLYEMLEEIEAANRSDREVIAAVEKAGLSIISIGPLKNKEKFYF